MLKNSKNLPKKNTLGGLVFRSFLSHLTPDRDERRRREKEEEHASETHGRHTNAFFKYYI